MADRATTRQKARCRVRTRAHCGAVASCTLLGFALFLAFPAAAQTTTAVGTQGSSAGSERRTSQDYNQRILELLQDAHSGPASTAQDYHIGADDLLQVSVYEAPDLNRTVRVSADGQVSLPPVGTVRAAGLTAVELEAVLEELLRRTYMKDPHVGVFVQEMQSHAVSVVGAVEKPGVYQIPESRSLLEVLSMAQGLAADAGDSVIVMHGGHSSTGSTPPSAPANPEPAPHRPAASATLSAVSLTSSESSTRIDLKALLDSADPRDNIPVYPGDVVKVPRAGVVYVVGEVNKPGGYVLKTNENISVLQAIALAEGLTHTSSAKHTRIIRTDPVTGARTEIRINLSKILAGHAPDPILEAKDIVFVPNSNMRAALYHGTEGIVSIVGGAAIYRW